MIFVLFCGAGSLFAQATTNVKPSAAKENTLTQPEATLRAAELSARATKESAEIAASANKIVGKATQDQIRDSAERQYYATVATAFVVLLGTIVTLYNARLTKQRLDEDKKENERKRLDARFVDIQDRLVSENLQERTNAVYALGEFARQTDVEPVRLRDRVLTISAVYSIWLNLGHRRKEILEPALKQALGTHKYPYFASSFQRLSSVLVLEPNDTVRSSAVRAASSVSDFAINSLEHYQRIAPPEKLKRGPYTRFVVEEMVNANREAYRQWLISWAQFVGSAHELDGAAGKHNIDPVDPSYFDFPRAPKIRDNESTQDFWERVRSIRQTRLLGQPDPESYSDVYDWMPYYQIWETARSSCPFVASSRLTEEERDDILTDFLLYASETPLFQEQWWIRLQILKSSRLSDEAKAEERVKARSSLAANSQKLIAARDALAATLRQCTSALTSDSWHSVILDDDYYERVGLDLRDTVLIGADLSGAIIPCSHLTGALLPAVNLQDAILRGSLLVGTWLDWNSKEFLNSVSTSNPKTISPPTERQSGRAEPEVPNIEPQ